MYTGWAAVSFWQCSLRGQEREGQATEQGDRRENLAAAPGTRYAYTRAMKVAQSPLIEYWEATQIWLVVKPS